MKPIDQITYRARNDGTGIINHAATSIWDKPALSRWWRRLEPWLRAGNPLGRAYLNFGTEAAFIRWYRGAQSQFDWQHALVLVGEADVLTGDYALELRHPDQPMRYQGDGQVPLMRTGPGPGRDAIEARARSAIAVSSLIPLLAHALRDERRVTMPWTEPMLPEAVMWGLITILGMIGETRPVSFHTYLSSASRDPNTPGLFVCFRPDAQTVLPPDPGFEALAADLATRFADDPDQLGQTLAQRELLEPADHAGLINRLLSLRPPVQANAAQVAGARQEQATTPGARPDAPAPASDAASPSATGRHGRHRSRDAAGRKVMCPMCLHEIEDWGALGYWRWDPSADGGNGEYVELSVPPGLNDTQLDHYLHGTRVRCPAPQADARIAHHYLPADYGSFGPPVVLGFVGLTRSGKSHLLASMVGAVVALELEKNYGITSSPLDHAWHRRFVDNWVNPLLKHGKVLPGTREGGVVEFADAFVMRARGGPERVVALFDVAGGDLARLDETKQFLWIADGLFFVVDPDRMSGQWTEDETFGNVLDIVRNRARRQPISAAIVLNKADLMRFEEPVDRWLRSADDVPRARPLDPVELLRESADVYAFLEDKNALAMTEPYEVCDKATLHVASPTGSTDTGADGVYPRGVTPRRVLRPLAALLAMTGVLTGQDAEKVGI